jgi:hypothetical protein
MSDSTLHKCPVCNGKKIIMGVGHMERKCDTCKGIGWIDVPKVLQEIPQQKNYASKELEKVIAQKKKMGRPRKAR